MVDLMVEQMELWEFIILINNHKNLMLMDKDNLCKVLIKLWKYIQKLEAFNSKMELWWSKAATQIMMALFLSAV